MLSFESHVSQYWWAILLRGVAAILFGLTALAAPGVTLAVLVLVFGAYALVDGMGAIVLGIKEYGDQQHWWATLVGGIVGVAAGLMTFLTPGMTAVALLLLIAFWAIVRGIFDIAAAVRLRHAIEGEWLLALSGALSVAFGVVMMLFPGAGALTVILWIGAYAIALGMTLVALSFRVRGAGRRIGA